MGFPLIGDISGFAGGTIGDLMGGLTGSKDANRELQAAQQRQRDELLRGQGQALGGMSGAYERGMGGLAPWSSAGQHALGDYAGLVAAGGNDSDIKRMTQEAMAQANSQGAMSGRMGSSWSAKAMGTALGRQLEAREQRKYDRLQTLMGFGSNAAAQQGHMSNAYGQGLAGLYTGTSGGLASSYGQSGMANAQAARGGWGDLMGTIGVASNAVGAFTGGRGGGGGQPGNGLGMGNYP